MPNDPALTHLLDRLIPPPSAKTGSATPAAPAPSFLAQHGDETAVAAGAIVVPLLLTALLGGRRDRRQRERAISEPRETQFSKHLSESLARYKRA